MSALLLAFIWLIARACGLGMHENHALLSMEDGNAKTTRRLLEFIRETNFAAAYKALHMDGADSVHEKKHVTYHSKVLNAESSIHISGGDGLVKWVMEDTDFLKPIFGSSHNIAIEGKLSRGPWPWPLIELVIITVDHKEGRKSHISPCLRISTDTKRSRERHNACLYLEWIGKLPIGNAVCTLSGTLLMNIVTRLASSSGILTTTNSCIQLHDVATAQCRPAPGGLRRPISLTAFSLISTGKTFYGKRFNLIPMAVGSGGLKHDFIHRGVDADKFRRFCAASSFMKAIGTLNVYSSDIYRYSLPELVCLQMLVSKEMCESMLAYLQERNVDLARIVAFVKTYDPPRFLGISRGKPNTLQGAYEMMKKAKFITINCNTHMQGAMVDIQEAWEYLQEWTAKNNNSVSELRKDWYFRNTFTAGLSCPANDVSSLEGARAPATVVAM